MGKLLKEINTLYISRRSLKLRIQFYQRNPDRKTFIRSSQLGVQRDQNEDLINNTLNRTISCSLA